MESSAQRVVTWFAVISLGILWCIFILWAISQWHDMGNVRERLMDRHRLAAELELNTVFKTTHAFLEASQAWIISNPEQDPLKTPQFIEAVQNFQKNTGNSVRISLVKKDGTSIFVADGIAESSSDVRYRDYIEASLRDTEQHLHIGMPYYGDLTDRWSIPIGVALNTPVKDIVLIQAVLDLDPLQSMLSKHTFSPSGAIALVRENGDLILNVPGKNWHSGDAVANWQGIDKMLKHQSTGILRNQRIQNEEHWIAFGKVSEFPFVITVTEQKNVVYAGWWSKLSVVAILIMLTSCITWLFTRRILSILKALEESQNELQLMAITDSLTGLYNRRHFFQAAEAEWNRSKRYQRSFSLIMLDIDFFKQVNDAPGLGHLAGDKLLINLAETCQSVLRDNDMICRMGGEEFAVILPETSIDGALPLAERLRTKISEMVTQFNGQSIQVTISLGVAESSLDEPSFDVLEHRADTALFHAKREGRNCVRIAPLQHTKVN